MYLILICVVGGLVLLFGLLRMRQLRNRRELEEHSIDADSLRELMEKNADILLFDVRQPLDLLAHSEIIPGAVRVAPKEVEANPMLVPKDKDAVIYCTCPGDETSRNILRRVLALEFTKVKMLRNSETRARTR